MSGDLSSGNGCRGSWSKLQGTLTFTYRQVVLLSCDFLRDKHQVILCSSWLAAL